MMKDMAPCKGCTDRYEACHGKCERYLSWKKRHDALREKIRRAKYPDSWVDATAIKDGGQHDR